MGKYEGNDELIYWMVILNEFLLQFIITFIGINSCVVNHITFMNEARSVIKLVGMYREPKLSFKNSNGVTLERKVLLEIKPHIS